MTDDIERQVERMWNSGLNTMIIADALKLSEPQAERLLHRVLDRKYQARMGADQDARH